MPPDQRILHAIPAKGRNLIAGLTIRAFPKFGLYCYQSQTMYLAIRCGRINANAPSGHFHNDQLALELNMNRVDIIADPGSYIYTPLPHRRNEYRSVKAHFAPRLKDVEPNPIGKLLFRLGDRTKAECLYFGKRGFLGMHKGYGPPLYRMVLLKENELLIHDFTEAQENIISEQPTRRTGNPPSSNGYGIIIKS